jgi:hypothetical protein
MLSHLCRYTQQHFYVSLKKITLEGFEPVSSVPEAGEMSTALRRHGQLGAKLYPDPRGRTHVVKTCLWVFLRPYVCTYVCTYV